MKRKQQRKPANQPSRAPAPPPQPRPEHADGQTEAIAHLKAGRLDEATALLREIVEAHPQSWQGLHLLGLIAYRQGHLKRAAGLIRQCLDVHPNLAEGFSDLGVVLKDLGEFDDAQIACEKAIAIKPGFPPAFSNLGNVFKAMGQLEDAVDCYRRAIELEPNFADAHANLSAVLLQQGDTENALISSQRAIDLAPNHPETLIAHGHALRMAGIYGEAMAAYRRVTELKPDFAPIYSDIGCVLQETGHLQEALQFHQRAIALQPGYAEAYSNLGITLKHLGRNSDACRAYETAIGLKPGYAEAYSNLGVVLDAVGKHNEAAASYRRAIELNPDLLHPYVNLAGALWEQNNLADSLALQAKALTIDPDHPTALVEHYNLCRHACAWDGIAAAEEKILSQTYRMGKHIAPFPVLNIPCGPEEHLLCAREWAKTLSDSLPAPFTHRLPRSASRDGRLRIGYLSADFNKHATANLIAELIERHDRSRFEIFGYCFSREDGSDLRARLINGFDNFACIGQLAHADAARRIHADGIDILVDLKGYTSYARTEILACRPAPIQVNYLGYPATMGANFIDYIIADDFILPTDQQPFYDESIVHLPGCYQPNDTKRAIAVRTPTRGECGLPEEAFVFCCFNNSYKITPQMFAVWMRLLKALPGSVLWLLEANDLVRDNLQRKAVAGGVDPARLVFAPKIDQANHLARHVLADLFLDTLPVNAHTTASDALWAGLPVLTCAGESLVARVCGSLLKAVDLSELITYSLEEYEETALRLPNNLEQLEELRQRLARNKSDAPLFNIARYTRGLEAAFEHMADIRADGDAPRAFSVTEVDEPDEEPRPVPPAAAKPAPAITASAPKSTAPERRAARIDYGACPLCNSPEISSYKEADCTRHPRYDATMPPALTWCRCGSCDHVFTKGYFAPEAGNAVLARNTPDSPVGHDIEAGRVAAARIVGNVARHKASGDWLDVGFGSASLLFTAEEWGFRPVGLDVHPENVQALKALGYETHCAPIEMLDFPGRFSVVSMADYLERTPFPRAALDAVHRLLQPAGVLFVATPNMATIVWRLLDTGGNNPFWGDIEHYHNFTRERLYALLQTHGFKPAAYAVSERDHSGMEVIAVKV
jgi:protein O-GlcNAc transferase